MKIILVFLSLMLGTVPLLGVKVLAFAGSTRAGSYNKQLIEESVKIATELGAEVTVVNLEKYPIPLYDADLEMQGMPQHAQELRTLMIAYDAIIIASPEYNCSIPAVLKNVLDWASRDEKGGASRKAFEGKRFAIMSASPGKRGGRKGLIHLSAIIEDLRGIVVPTQVSISQAHEYFSNKKKAENLLLKEEIQELLLVKNSSM